MRPGLLSFSLRFDASLLAISLPMLSFFAILLVASSAVAQSGSWGGHRGGGQQGGSIAMPEPARATAQTAQGDEHLPPVSAKINALAHKVLAAGWKLNGLTGGDVKPYHLKASFQIYEGKGKPAEGSFEQWYASEARWRIDFKGPEATYNGTEWSASRLERYKNKPAVSGFSFADLRTRLSRPVIDPLFQAANAQADTELKVARVTADGGARNCVSAAEGAWSAESANPDALIPTYCFDADLHLRLMIAGDVSVSFDEIQPFQNRFVAHDVKVMMHGRLQTEIRIAQLESVAEIAEETLKPAKNAVAEPFLLEPGMPLPEAVYQVGAKIPLQPDDFPFRGVFLVRATLRKDGSVKARNDDTSVWNQDLKDALMLAVNQWKYKPYVVDGQPVEVAMNIGYRIDGKPFAPVYDRPKPAPVATAPEDFSSAFDPRRDAEKDLALAEAQAAKENKRILVEVGGDWCAWCKRMDQFFNDHAEAKRQRDAGFVLLKVNMSVKNENAGLLSRYPAIASYPFVLVLDASGKLLKAQETQSLEDGAGGYNDAAVKDFLHAWAAAAQ